MFLIIWGIRNYTKTLAMLSLACRNGHVAAHRLMKVTKKLTIFFIPVLPLRVRYFSVCAACGLTQEWDKESALAAAAQASPDPAELAAAGPRSWGGGGQSDPILPPVRTGLPAAGWYPDPAGGQGLRYWDGHAWTESVHDG